MNYNKNLKIQYFEYFCDNQKLGGIKRSSLNTLTNIGQHYPNVWLFKSFFLKSLSVQVFKSDRLCDLETTMILFVLGPETNKQRQILMKFKKKSPPINIVYQP